MAEGTANPLIMALRANTAPSGSMPPGVKNISFPWQTNNTGPLVIPNRPIKPKVTTPTPPPPVNQPAPPKVTTPTPPDANMWRELSDRLKSQQQPVDTANPILNLQQRDPQPPVQSPVDSIDMNDMDRKFNLDQFSFDPQTQADPAAVTTPVTDEMSVRQTLEQILADQAPQPVEPPTQVAPPRDLNIPAFNSNIDFQMPDTLFATPAPFVPGFTPQADVARSMAPIVQEPEPPDPNLLAMLGIQPAPATQPVPEEPIYGAQVPAWYFNEFGFDGNR